MGWPPRWMAVFFHLFTLVVAYSEPCPSICRCSVSILECSDFNERQWHDIQVFLSAPDAASTLNITLRRGIIPTLKFFPFLSNLEHLELSNSSIREIDFPTNIRLNTMQSLTLADNDIRVLGEDALVCFPNLEFFSIRNNNLSLVTYEQLKLIKLRSLDLSWNNLIGLPARAFRFLGNLETLDLSGNRLKRAQSSDFRSHRLKYLNLSHNEISHFDFDTFAKNIRIESLDLSYNKLSRSPGPDLKQVVNLLMLNVSGNPIERFGSWDFEFDRLQVLAATDMRTLRAIDSAAFSKSRDLRFIDLSRNPHLEFISPSAFENCSAIHRIDLSSTNICLLSSSIIKDVAQVRLEDAALDCGCMASEVDNIASTTIENWEHIRCINDGESRLLSQEKPGPCPPMPLTPFGKVTKATVGSTFYLHCAARSEEDEVFWTLLNGTKVEGLAPMKPQGISSMDYFANSLYHPDTQYIPTRPRIYASREWLRFDVLAPEDAGTYKCTVRRGKKEISVPLTLEVESVPISVEVTATGPHYLSLSWSQGLQVTAVDRVVLRLRISDNDTGYERSLQLSLHNPWTSYNVMRLRPNTNYTVCLEYAMADSIGNPLVSSCIIAATQEMASLFSVVNSKIVLVILAIVLFFVFVHFSFKAYNKMHIWQQAKKKSRMAASLSGQSIVSHSSATGATYENQQLALRRVDSATETRVCLLESQNV